MLTVIKRMFMAGPQTVIWSIIFAAIGAFITKSILVTIVIQIVYIGLILAVDYFIKFFTPHHG